MFNKKNRILSRIHILINKKRKRLTGKKFADFYRDLLMLDKKEV